MGQDGPGSKPLTRAELAARTLWSASTCQRYFLLPDDLPMVAAMGDAKPPEGMFELGSLTGGRRFVREEDVQAYETTRDQAAEWLLMEFDPQIQQLKAEAIARAEEMLEAAAEDRGE